MSFNQKEDYNGRLADRINLANEKTTGPREMISVLSQDNIKPYLSEKGSKNVGVNYLNERPDFSDLLKY